VILFLFQLGYRKRRKRERDEKGRKERKREEWSRPEKDLLFG